jgi:hypothetical protein
MVEKSITKTASIGVITIWITAIYSGRTVRPHARNADDGHANPGITASPAEGSAGAVTQIVIPVVVAATAYISLIAVTIPVAAMLTTVMTTVMATVMATAVIVPAAMTAALAVTGFGARNDGKAHGAGGNGCQHPHFHGICSLFYVQTGQGAALSCIRLT